ncbi:MAG: DUF1579 domain-containing protein [Planctomycetota bacterium]
MKTLVLTAVSLLWITPFALAQDAKDKPAKPAVDASMQMPKPGPEHANLKKAEGNWDVAVESPGFPAAKGVSEQKMTLKGFWLVDKFSCDWNGTPFEGRGTTGYDPIKGKYVSTWVDSMSPTLTVTEGTFDEKTRTLNMLGDGYNEKGEKVKVRTATIHKDANTVVFEMYNKGSDGKESQVMSIKYTRSAASPAKPAK